MTLVEAHYLLDSFHALLLDDVLYDKILITVGIIDSNIGEGFLYVSLALEIRGIFDGWNVSIDREQGCSLSRMLTIVEKQRPQAPQFALQTSYMSRQHYVQ